MTLASGSRLGPYEISSKLGEGGMGEVYKARDTRLGRTVAIKILSASFAEDAELRSRLEREARAISSLQHPHICTLFDIGRDGERDYLVMEYLEGEPLSVRLARGKLSLEETLRYGRQIAEALDKAHRHGIVHRDLKPGNVILTRSGVKLLDFGLAKLQMGLATSPLARPLDSKTVLAGSEPLTLDGMVVGTPEFMAPEQLEGRETDARCDLWALGCVLFQMITGQRPYARENLASVITAVMSSDPLVPEGAEVPPGLERLIRFCLTKDPEQRWQSAHDLVLELTALTARPDSFALPAETTSPRGLRRLRLRYLGGGLVAGLLLAALALVFLRAPAAGPRPPVRFQVSPPPGVEISQNFEGRQLAISPDGRTLAFVGSDETPTWRVYLRPLGAQEATPLMGTEGVSSIFWSPDGKALAFFGNGKLKRLDLEGGGAPVILCDVDPGIGYSGSWSRQGEIVFASVQGKVLMRIPATGGDPELLLEPDPAKQETRIGWPVFLPDGKRLLYQLRKENDDSTLMLFEPGRPPQPLVAIDSRFELVEPDVLVYVREGALIAQRIDVDQAKLVGAPQAIVSELRYFYSTGWAAFAISPSGGTLFYLTERDSSRFYVYDRSGRQQGSLGPVGTYLNLTLADDGKSLLTDRMQTTFGTYDIWQLDLEQGIENRLTTSPAAEFAPFPLPGGKAMIYSVVLAGSPNLVLRQLLAGEEQHLLPSTGFQQIWDVAADGKQALFTERAEKGGFRGYRLNLVGEKQAQALFPATTEQACLRFSPDARHIAFLSNDNGEREAYVAPLDNPNDRIRLSRQGAARLRWRRDGREILWWTPQGEMVAVEVKTEPRLEVGEPRVLFRLNADVRDFDVDADGQRLILLVREKRGGAEPASVILDGLPLEKL